MLALAGTLLAPALAEAGEVEVSLAEDPGGVTVRIRGLVEGAQADRIVTSRSGALLFVPGEDALPQRLRPLERHRLDYVQVGRAGDRVAVRVVQRKQAKGLLSKHMHSTPVAGGFDVRIQDVPVPASQLTPAPSTVGAVTLDHAAALAQIAGTQAPVAVVAVAPTTAPVAPTIPAPQPVAVAAAAPAELPAMPSAQIFGDDALAPDAVDDSPRWAAAAATSQQAPLDLKRSAPQIGMAWLATAMLAFSGLGLLWWRRRRPMLDAPQPLRVLARVAIGPKQQIVWISAGGRSLLVGATEQRIEMLADLSEPAAQGALAPQPVADPVAAATAAATAAPDGRVAAFKQRLRAALGDEVAGRHDEAVLPPHLEMLTGDPRWVGRKETA